jgi:DNA-binding MarR family transcriptional regulator
MDISDLRLAPECGHCVRVQPAQHRANSGRDTSRVLSILWLTAQGSGLVGRTEPADDRLSLAELAAWRGMIRVHSHLLRELDAEMTAGQGLTLRTYEVLLFLGDAPQHRLRMSELSQSVLLSASGVSRLVDRLARDGYVRRERCGQDGRGLYAALTPAGAKKLREARSTHLEGIRRVFLERFSAADLARLAGYWERVLPGAAGTAAPSRTRETRA